MNKFIKSISQFIISTSNATLEVPSLCPLVLKNFSKFTDKHKKQSFGGILSKDVLENWAKFTEKHLCRSLFVNKAAG